MPSEMNKELVSELKTWVDALREDDDYEYESYDEDPIINQILPTTSANTDGDNVPFKYDDGKYILNGISLFSLFPSQP